MTENASGASGPVVGGLSRPILLPSRGFLYGRGPAYSPVIQPIRGEQEELLAGAGEGSDVTTVLRHVVAQVTDLQGLPYEDLLVSDWMALLLNIMAFSYNPILSFRPKCPTCKKFQSVSKNVEEMECKVIDPDKAGLYKEPFETPPLPLSKDVITWRLLRIKDFIQAEAYAKQREESQVVPGNPFHTYIIAKHILKIRGKDTEPIQAMEWVRKAYAKDLRALNEEFEKKETGYDMTLKFACVHCGASFAAMVPLDGSFFRSTGSKA